MDIKNAKIVDSLELCVRRTYVEPCVPTIPEIHRPLTI
jgi:hypothetical protein